MFIFWPITDDEDVIDKDNDWICCCGIIHSFFGALLFMFADMIKIPLILSAYIGIQQYLDLQFAIDDVFFSAPIIASTIALIASPLGPIAFIRSFLCLRSSHVCSPLHNKIVVFAMFTYFIRVVLFALFSLVFTGYSLSVILHGCYWFECVKRAIHFSLWIFISLDYSIGCCLCYKALGFFRGRYRGYWDTKPSIPRKSK